VEPRRARAQKNAGKKKSKDVAILRVELTPFAVLKNTNFGQKGQLPALSGDSG